MPEDRNSNSTPTVSEAWSREIERRLREIDEKTVELIDWEEFRAEFMAVD